jgi:hypothetical protein
VTDSLTIADQFELAGQPGGVPSADPRCPGAKFQLMPSFDLGAPEPTSAVVASLLLDGEHHTGYRFSNRTIVLPVKITAPDFFTLAAAREVLLQAINAPSWPMRWTRDTAGPLAGATTAMPLIFDCERAGASTLQWGGPDGHNRNPIALMGLTFEAQPFGRSDVPVIVDFTSPLAGVTAPPSPVTVDSYSSVSGTNFTQSLIGPGPNSAHWSPPGGNPTGTGISAAYAKTGLTLNLTGLTALTAWVGFGSTQYFQYWARAGGPVTFSLTLTDNASHVLSFAKTIRNVKGSNSATSPKFVKLRVPIPQITNAALPFNFASVTAYSFNVTNRAAGDLRYANFYMDSLTAVPPQVQAGIAPQRGWVYDLAGIVGTARGPASWQFQQGSPAVLTTQRFNTVGTTQWVAPSGVTSATVQCIGPGGGGSSRIVNSSAGGAGGSGEWAQEAGVALTPGNLYAITIPPGGGSGSTSPGTVFTGDAITVTAHAGASAAANSTVGGAAGSGSANTSHFSGAAGGAGNNGGFGGGGAGSAGHDAAGHAGVAGSSGGAGGAAGGGTFPNNSGSAGGKGATSALAQNVTGSPGAGVGGGGGGGGKGTSPGFGFGGLGGQGQVTLTYLAPPTFQTLVAHRPSRDQPDTLCPFVSPGVTDVPDGTTEYPVPSLIAGLNARFAGTYTVILVNNAWHSPALSRTLMVTVNEYEYVGGPVVSVPPTPLAVIPNNLNSPMVTLGELTLPVKALAPENYDASFTVTITSSDTADTFLDVLFLDTMGSTVKVETATAYQSMWVDEPTPEADLGLVLASSFDRGDAISVLDRAQISGPGLGVDPDNNQTLLVYAVEGAPSVELTYWPRWWMDRFS